MINKFTYVLLVNGNIKEILLPPINVLKSVYLFLEITQPTTQVLAVVLCLKQTKNDCIVFAVWFFHIANLETCLE